MVKWTGTSTRPIGMLVIRWPSVSRKCAAIGSGTSYRRAGRQLFGGRECGNDSVASPGGYSGAILGVHDSYGKRVLREACYLAGDRIACSGHSHAICDGINCNLDAFLESGIAVEIESRVDKQVRGAMLDLLIHSATAKLMVLIPAHMSSSIKTKEMCEAIATTLAPAASFLCCVLTGTGHSESLGPDSRTVADAIIDLSARLRK